MNEIKSDENRLIISDKMNDGPFKKIMEFLENDHNASIIKIMAEAGISTKEKTVKMVNLLRKLGFAKTITVNKTRFFSAHCTIDPNELPSNINEYIKIGALVLPKIEKIINNEIEGKIIIENNAVKDIKDKDIHEFNKVLPQIIKGIIIYKCPSSGDLIIRVKSEKIAADTKTTNTNI